MLMGLQTQIRNAIKLERVIIFSKSYCPFCELAKLFFRQRKIDVTIWELNHMDDGKHIQDELYKITKQKTVPNIFINGCHVGGYSDLEERDQQGLIEKYLNLKGPKEDI